MNDSITPIRVIAALMGIAVLSFVVRVADMGTDLNAFRVLNERTGNQIIASQNISDPNMNVFDLTAIEPAAGGKKEKAHEENENVHEEDHGDAHAGDGAEHAEITEENTEEDLANLPEWRDPSDTDLTTMTVKQEVFNELAQRRSDLDDREKGLQAREALLKAAEQELEQKYVEMTTLRNELELLLDKQTEEEKARIASLVKVYENMKPKDAARIFDTLDLDILLDVAAQMSERKLSPVLAAMNAERARTITIMLAEQKKLPEPKSSI